MSAILSLDEALCGEFDEIERRRHNAGAPADSPGDVVGEDAATRARRLNLTALCLSGGGIRSAAFGLGVMQSLAARNLLNRFDYLSTVSGGGYIGSWLQLLLLDHCRNAGASVDQTLGELGNGTLQALRRLRGFTNFLTPQTGPFSADTWAGIMLYQRNLLINWSLFLPLLLLLTLVPIFYRTALYWLYDVLPADLALLGVAVVALGAATYFGCRLLPSHRPSGGSASQTRIAWCIATPAIAWAYLVPFAIEYGLAQQNALLRHTTHEVVTPTQPLAASIGLANLPWLGHYDVAVPLLYVIALWIGYELAGLTEAFGAAINARLYRANRWRWLIASSIASGLIWVGLQFLYPNEVLHRIALWTLPGGRPWLIDTETALAVFAPLWLAGTHVLQTTVYVGLRRNAAYADLDREWLARLSGLVMRVACAWSALAFCCLVLPTVVLLMAKLDTTDQIDAALLSKLFGGSTVLGALVAWMGKQAKAQLDTVAEQAGGWKTWLLSSVGTRWLLNILAVLFAAMLLIAIAAIEGGTLGGLQRLVAGNQFLMSLTGKISADPQFVARSIPIALQLLIAILLTPAIVLFGHVNVNRFSMHAVYRNRLTRAFLGSARAPQRRRPDQFTGFDLSEDPAHGILSSDNPHLAEFRDVAPGQRLFPVINMTLNVTAGSNTAWAERKGECFIATPLVCGAAELPHPDQRNRGDLGPALGAFAPVTAYAGAETLREVRHSNLGARIGSAMTVSGAAISPNWGYHSSRATALLMALFNVRLGAWLPNPSVRQSAASLQIAGPRHSLWALLFEMLGSTSDQQQAVYLSDGGHFENLGIYEMLRRRCRQIVVIDAGQDAKCAFFDLGNAIRKAEVDLAARVTMRSMRICSRDDNEQNRHPDAIGFAVGDIAYADGGSGQLIYLKPSWLDGMPAQVKAFAHDHPTFPHVSTLQQWFGEDEFESYRALGAWQMQQLTGAMQQPSSLDGLFAAADQLCPP